MDRKLRRNRIDEVALAIGPWQSQPGPLYAALAAAIRASIAGGALPTGLPLPSERLLAGRLAVSRSTVVAAYRTLKAEGWLRARRGSGTVVQRRDAGRAAAPQSALFGGIETPPPRRIVVDFSVASPPALPWVAAELAACARELERVARSTHGYEPGGLAALRAAIAEHYTVRGLPTSPDEILVTSGAQQAIALCALSLLPAGAAVAVERPTFPGAVDALRASGAQVRAVSLHDGELDLEALDDAVRRNNARALYVTPTFNNPTGRSLGAESRVRPVEHCQRLGIAIVEDLTMEHIALDDPGTASEPLAMLATPTSGARILTIGSAGKIFWGGLRLGWVRAATNEIAHLRQLKIAADLSCSMFGQLAGLRLIGRTADARRDRAAELAPKRDLLCAQLANVLPAWRWERPAGGVSLWITLPRGDGRSFARVAAEHGVGVAPGSAFAFDQPHDAHIRVAYTASPQAIEAGVARLAQAWDAYRAGAGATEPPLIV